MRARSLGWLAALGRVAFLAIRQPAHRPGGHHRDGGTDHWGPNFSLEFRPSVSRVNPECLNGEHIGRRTASPAAVEAGISPGKGDQPTLAAG